MDLTTKDRYFEFFPDAVDGAAKASFTAQLGMRISAVSKSVIRYLEKNGRHVESKERVEKFTPAKDGTRNIRLKGYPVAEIDLLTVFDDGWYSEDGDFVLDAPFGTILFNQKIYRDDDLYLGAISVTYTGGMAADTAGFISEYPDIESAVLMQVNFELSRYKSIANKSQANGAATTSYNEYGLLPELARVLDSYCPMVEP